LISPQDYSKTLASRLDTRKEIRRSIMHGEMHADRASRGRVEITELWISGISGLQRSARWFGNGPIA
jgi:hypothetical protein